MINEHALKQIKMLEGEYEKTWDKKVDYTIVPRGMTQEKLVNVLKIMIETNDSMMVAYSKYNPAI